MVRTSTNGKDESVFGLTISVSAFSVSCLAYISLVFAWVEILRIADFKRIAITTAMLLFVGWGIYKLFKIVSMYYRVVQYGMQKYTEIQQEIDDKRNKKC